MSVSVEELISMIYVKGWFTQTENELQDDFLCYLLPFCTNRFGKDLFAFSLSFGVTDP